MGDTAVDEKFTNNLRISLYMTMRRQKSYARSFFLKLTIPHEDWRIVGIADFSDRVVLRRWSFCNGLLRLSRDRCGDLGLPMMITMVGSGWRGRRIRNDRLMRIFCGGCRCPGLSLSLSPQSHIRSQSEFGTQCVYRLRFFRPSNFSPWLTMMKSCFALAHHSGLRHHGPVCCPLS
jgi:hypothetical protein